MEWSRDGDRERHVPMSIIRRDRDGDHSLGVGAEGVSQIRPLSRPHLRLEYLRAVIMKLSKIVQNRSKTLHTR
eukprot:6797718-Prymnesium_polylepis.1